MSFFHLQDPQFLDINSDFLQVTLLLGDIQVSTDELQNLASTYTSYQNTFKVFRINRVFFFHLPFTFGKIHCLT